MRRLALLLLALVAAVPPAVDAKQRKRSACQRLQHAREDLSPHKRLVLAERGSFEYGSLSACVLPRGRIRALVEWDDGLGRAGGELEATKGYWVLASESWNDQYGGTSLALRRFDARTGKSVTLAAYGCQRNPGPSSPCADGTSFGQLVLARTGAGAMELSDFATGLTTLRSFAPDGTLAQLDDGPVSDLRLERGEIVWTRDGSERRAPLPR